MSQERINQVAADESGAAGDESLFADCVHRLDRSSHVRQRVLFIDSLGLTVVD
jgi:hypothetical protein